MYRDVSWVMLWCDEEAQLSFSGSFIIQLNLKRATHITSKANLVQFAAKWKIGEAQRVDAS